MKRISSLINFTILLSICVTAQTKLDQYLVDELGDDNWESRAARMDMFSSMLDEKPESKGIIEIYGGTAESLSFPFVSGALLKAYLTNNRGYNPSRFQIINCRNQERGIRHRVYIVPNSVKTKTCETGIDVPSNTTNIGTRFEVPSDYVPHYDGGCCVTAGGDAAANRAVMLLTKRLIELDNNARFHLIGYGGEFQWDSAQFDENGKAKNDEPHRLDTKADAMKFVDQVKEALVKQGLSENQISVAFGGFRDYQREVDIWYVEPPQKVLKY